MCKKDVAASSGTRAFPAVPPFLALPFRWVGLRAFPAAFLGGASCGVSLGGLSSFLFCGVFSWFLLLSLAVLFLLSLVSFGLGLSWCLASAGVLPLALFLSGSPARRLRWLAVLVALLRQLCLLWWLLSVPPVCLVLRCPSAFVLAGLPPVGSAPWLLLLRVLSRLSFLFPP